MNSSLPLFDSNALPDPTLVAGEMRSRARPVDAGHFDELRDAAGQLREHWSQFAAQFGAPLSDLDRRQAMLARQILEDGVTYNIYSDPDGSSRPWSLELLPMLIGSADWAQIERGILQRTALLNTVLTDVYSEQRLLKDAMLPAALVFGHPGYLRGLQGVPPPGGTYLHVVAFDLVRGSNGAWSVVSQRTQAPSGLGYVMQNRLVVSRLFPEAYRAMNIQHLASAYRRLVESLYALAETCARGQTPRLALWTPGPFNETYFEHAYLARYLGLPLVEGGDLIVRDERVYLKTVQGLEPLHGLLRRLDDDFCDPLELRSDSTLGVPGLLQAVRAGNVVVSNALGSGFLESPAIQGFLPALSQRLLGEELALPSLPTWWCGEAAAWQSVSPDIDKKVIRATFPTRYAAKTAEGGQTGLRAPFEAVMGPTLTASEKLAWRQRIEADPQAYTAQDFFPYAQTPVWTQGQLAMRSASLRVYALANGLGGWQVLPGGMTRIATKDDGPVSMQFGGSSLDTWVMTEGAVDTYSMLPQPMRWEDLAQRQRPVASRVGENLFWMGRYTERAEQQMRLVQVLMGLLDHNANAPDRQLVDTMQELALSYGLVPKDTPTLIQSPRVFERAVIEALSDSSASQGAYSLAFNLSALAHSSQVLRDRLSAEHDRLLRAMATDFNTQLRQETQGVANLASAREALAHLAVQLSAVTGAQSDRMTRDAGWRLLTVGRLIERLSGYARFLEAFVQHQSWNNPAGFDALMMLFDSQITFRARFQRRLEWPAMVATLVTDEDNPRALACVLRRLRTELGKLPEGADALQTLLDLLPRTGVGVQLADLVDANQGTPVLSDVCQRLNDASWHLSDELGLRYFAHAEPHEQTLST